MKNKNCIICSNYKGKRVCKVNNNSLICPVCCAKTRTPDCDGCIYYTQAQRFAKEKTNTQKSEEFFVAFYPEIDETVDKALAMVEKGKIESGKKIITDLFIKHPNYHTVQYAMGVLCVMQDRYDDAIRYFDKAVKIYPYFVEAWFNKGAAHHRKLEIGEMIKAFQKVVELGEPSDDFVRHAKNFIKGLEKQVSKKNGLTLDGYLKAMDIFNDAFAAMGKKEWEKAIAGFQKVLSFEPQHTQSYGNIGICYAFLGLKQDALNAFDKALELDPDYEPAILNRIAVASLEEGERLSKCKYESVEYYKDYSLRDKSLIGKILNNLKMKSHN